MMGCYYEACEFSENLFMKILVMLTYFTIFQYDPKFLLNMLVSTEGLSHNVDVELNYRIDYKTCSSDYYTWRTTRTDYTYTYDYTYMYFNIIIVLWMHLYGFRM